MTFLLSAALCFGALGTGHSDSFAAEQTTMTTTTLPTAKSPLLPIEQTPYIDMEKLVKDPVPAGPPVDFFKSPEGFPEAAEWNETHDYNADQEVLQPDGEIKNLSIQFGRTSELLNITWFSKSSAQGTITFKDESGKILTSSVTTQPSISVPGYYQNRAVVYGLDSNTYYTYRVANGNTVSPSYTYRTGDLYSKDFTFAVVADQEIGLGDEEDNVLATQGNAWRLSLNRIKERMPDASFILSLGDQVAKNDAPEQYDQLLDKSVLYSIPFLPVVGNHDVGSGYWGDHFNPPNMSALGTSQGNDGDYWFMKGNALFMVLNTDSVQEMDVHETFVAETIAKNPQAKWRIVASHYSPVSNVEKYQPQREHIFPLFSSIAEKYQIDLFLGAHDHAYSRSYFLNADSTPADAGEGLRGEFHNPGKSMFLVLNTATGSLYRGPADYPWSAYSSQECVPQVTQVHVTENSLAVSTFHADSWVPVDSFTIYKN